MKPAIKASKDILGDDGVYYMVAFGTMQESAAFRNLCRSYKFDMEQDKDKYENGKFKNSDKNREIDKKIDEFNKEYNEVAKNLDNFRNDSKWGKLIEESKPFIGVIDSIAPSPCSFLLLSQPISEEIGLIRVGDEVCAYIDGYTSDKWGYLKNDFLTVAVWDNISETFDIIGRPIPTIRELDSLLDEKVWNLYEYGITTTLNQVDSDFATNLVKKYKPRNVAELSAFVAAIRPGFASLLNHFIDRKPYTTHIPALDEILKDSYHYLLYQESIMKMLIWCGIPEDETYDVIKKIAKKKFAQDELITFKKQLKDGFVKQTGKDDYFDDVWQVVEDAVRYSFNASHSYSMAYDSLYCAYLKANYPIEYYKVVLDFFHGDTERTNKLISELSYFNIKIKPIRFRYSKSQHEIDKQTNTIYKGMASVKYLSNQLGEELYCLRGNHYTTFLELLKDIRKKTSCNSRQLEILIRLDFFEEFGEENQLLKMVELFEWTKRKQISRKDIGKTPFTEYQFEKHSKTKTDKMFKDIDFMSMIKENIKNIEPKKTPIKEKAKYQLEYLGYLDLALGVDGQNCYIVDIDTKFTPRITVVSLNNNKILSFRIKKEYLALLKLEKGDIIYIHKAVKKPRWRKMGEHKNGKPKFERIPNEFQWEIANCERILEEDIYKDRSGDYTA